MRRGATALSASWTAMEALVIPRYESRTAVSHVSDIAPYTPSRSH